MKTYFKALLSLVLVFVWQSSRAEAVLKCEKAFAPIGVLSTLSKDIPNANSEILKTSVVSEDVRSWIGPSHFGAGTMAGIYQVKILSGDQVALKIWDLHSDLQASDLSVAFYIQKVLGTLGFAPKFYGVIAPEEISKVAQKFSLMKPRLGRAFSFGVLVENIPGALPVSGGNIPKEWLKSWNKEQLLHRIDELESTLNHLRILAIKPQIMISREGNLVLSHTHEFQWISEKNESYGQGAEHSRNFWRNLWGRRTVKNDLSLLKEQIEDLFKFSR